MEKWLIENMIWVGLGLGIMLLATKYLVVHIYKRLVALDAEGRDQSQD